ncbi:hypothetical protein HYV72_01835, partial [Candidatus Uhrbacteria bacterium]|nr:hypothetical protein [Candidatus Uhrbacteria bacterium]
MNPLFRLYQTLVDRLCGEPGSPSPAEILAALIEELRQATLQVDDDAVCYVVTCRVWSGTIAQLTHDVDDPGFVIRVSHPTKGLRVYDLCASAQRKNCDMATAVRIFEPWQFLAEDPTTTLARRAQLLE